jgi:hypothetical protein
MARAEPAQRAAALGRPVGGMLAGEFRKIGAAIQLFADLLCLVLGGDQNMGGVVFGAGGRLLEARVIGRLDCRIGHRRLDRILQGQPGQIGAAVVFQRKFIAPRHQGFGGLRQRGLLDHLIEDALEQHVIGQRLILVGQLRPQDRHDAPA